MHHLFYSPLVIIKCFGYFRAGRWRYSLMLSVIRLLIANHTDDTLNDICTHQIAWSPIPSGCLPFKTRSAGVNAYKPQLRGWMSACRIRATIRENALIILIDSTASVHSSTLDRLAVKILDHARRILAIMEIASNSTGCITLAFENLGGGARLAPLDRKFALKQRFLSLLDIGYRAYRIFFSDICKQTILGKSIRY